MSEYRMKCLIDDLEREKQRAQRAEAECERLTRWIKWYLDQFDEQDWTTEDQMVLEAVREGAPPPEVEPQSSGVDNLLDEMSADIDSISDEEIRAESSPGDAEEMRHVIESATAPHTPEKARIELVGQVYELVDQIERTLHLFGGDDEGRSQAIGAIEHARRVAAPYNYNGGDTQQAHGDALAAFERIASGDHRIQDYAFVRHALTASGVPEEVRRLMDSWRRRISNLRRGAKSASDYELARSSEIHLEELEAALASAPAVPPVTQEMVDEINSREGWSGFTLDDLQMIRDAIAAAPTDGREHG